MDGQLSIFDVFPTEKGNWWDSDINQLDTVLNAWADEVGCRQKKSTFGIWEHVPSLGYRYTFTAYFVRDLPDDDIDRMLCEINKYDGNGIEVSVTVTPPIGQDKLGIMVSTRFTDERKKIK